MKKILSILCVIALSVLFSACDADNNTSDTTSVSANNSSKAELSVDKTSYNFGDTVKINVSLPQGNVSKCTLITVPEHISITDTARMLSESLYTQKDFTESKTLSTSIDDNWFLGNYEIRLIADEQAVAKCTLKVEDTLSKYGVPTDVKFENKYIATDPADIYISDLAVSCVKSEQLSNISEDSAVSYEFRIKADGGQWSEAVKIKEKQISQTDDGQGIKISLLKLSSYKNGIDEISSSKSLADVYAVLENVIDVTKPIPGEYDYGRAYIDTTKHNIEVQIRYSAEGEICHWCAPVVIGVGY